MAEYKAIHGTTVSNRTSDPLVSGTAAGSWSSGGDVNTARYELGAGQAATTHATAIIFAGYNGTAFVANAETYNGSAWSETGDLNTARGAAVGGSGNSSTALAVGALVIIVALVLLAPVGLESHSKLSPPLIVATSLLPKLSNDHNPGAVTMSPDAAAFQEK